MIGQPGFVVAGKFRLEKLIGEGGMGHVWRAWDQSLDRAVAVKFISDVAAANASARQRFLAEARAAAGLRTPHVVQIIEQGVEGDTPFIVMELLEGEDLHQRMKRRKRLTPPEVCEIVRQLGRGLRVAHEAGVIHRDLKPANVFLSRVDDDAETVKILDFGIAKLQQPGVDHLTATNELVGSVYYMSPEQIRGHKDYDHRVDLWALGIMIFRTLTGKLPFRGENVGAVAVEICTGAIPKALAMVPTLPAGIDEFLAQALSRDPEMRFASARALSRALDAVCSEEDSPNSEPYLSTPPSAAPFPVIDLPSEPPPGSDDDVAVPAPPSRRRRAGLASRLIVSTAPPESSEPPPSSERPVSSGRPPMSEPVPASFRPSQAYGGGAPEQRTKLLSDPAPPSSRRRAAMARRMVSSAPPSGAGASSAPSSPMDLHRPVSSRRPARVGVSAQQREPSSPNMAIVLRDSGAVVGMGLLATLVGMSASGVAGRPSLLAVVGFAFGGAAALVSAARIWGHRSHAALTVAALALGGVGAGAVGMAAAGLVPGLEPMVPAVGTATRLAAAVVCLAFSAFGLIWGRERAERGDKGVALAIAVFGLLGIAVAVQLVRGSF